MSTLTEVSEARTSLQSLGQPPTGLVVDGDDEIRVRILPLLAGRLLLVAVLVGIVIVFGFTANPAIFLLVVLVVTIVAVAFLAQAQFTITPHGIEYRVGIGILGIVRHFPRDEIVGVVFDEGGPPEGKNTRQPHLLITQLDDKGLRFNRLVSGIRKDQAEWIIQAGQLRMGDWREGHAGRLLPERVERPPDDPTSDS